MGGVGVHGHSFFHGLVWYGSHLMLLLPGGSYGRRQADSLVS